MRTTTIAKIILGTLPLLLLAACTTPSQIAHKASYGILPCAYNEIVVSNLRRPGFSDIYYWDATCKGISYKCRGRTTGRLDFFLDVFCGKIE